MIIETDNDNDSTGKVPPAEPVGSRVVTDTVGSVGNKMSSVVVDNACSELEVVANDASGANVSKAVDTLLADVINATAEVAMVGNSIARPVSTVVVAPDSSLAGDDSATTESTSALPDVAATLSGELTKLWDVRRT